MRIALFGGTFDPPHRGHLAIATAAADTLRLDRVLFAPVGRQPLKPQAHAAPYIDRLSMVMLACEHDHRFKPSSLDAPNPNGKPNYTVDTLTMLRALYPEAALFNLVGADSFLALPHWHEPRRLLELAEWIVVSRPGFSLDSVPLSLTPQERSRIHLVESVHDSISATEIRQRLHEGNSCEGILLPEVLNYIRAHRLYC